MEYIGRVKYVADAPNWAESILEKDVIYRATDLSVPGFINIELDIEPKSYYTDIADKFEIAEDNEGKLENLFAKRG